MISVQINIFFSSKNKQTNKQLTQNDKRITNVH